MLRSAFRSNLFSVLLACGSAAGRALRSSALLSVAGFALLSCVTAAFATAAGDDYTASIEQWRAGRVERLTSPTGWLTLIGRHPLEHGTWSVGSAAGNVIRLAAGPEKLGTITYAADGKVSFALAEGVDATIDGTTARSAELSLNVEKPTYVRAGTVNFYVMDRSGKLFVRVRDSEAARRRNFAGIEAFPIDPAWRIEADWVPFDPPHTVKITNIIGLTEAAQVPGKAVFQHDGKTYELIPIDEGPDEDLFFVLTDTTAGHETYEACRFLYAKRAVNGKVILDFNKVYNPPCAFSPFATCPLPPKENVLPFALRAGEKKYSGAH
jgi:uncharacterized protein (DUF1684 family)